MEGLFEEKLCLNCGRKADKLCSACRSVVFCNATCQRAIWRKHKVDCKELAASQPKPAKAGPSFGTDVKASSPVVASKDEQLPTDPKARASDFNDESPHPQMRHDASSCMQADGKNSLAPSPPHGDEVPDNCASNEAADASCVHPAAAKTKPAAKLLAGWRGPVGAAKAGAKARPAERKTVSNLSAEAVPTLAAPFLAFRNRGVSAQGRRHGEELWAKGIVEYLDAACTNRSMTAGLEAFQASVEVDTSQSERHYFIGCLLVTAGRVDEAIQSFEAAIEANPMLESAHLDLVLLLDQLRRHDAARAAAARAVKAGVRWCDEWQRVAIHEPGLAARAWWDRSDFAWAEALESRYTQIKEELVVLMCHKGSREGSMPSDFPAVGGERGMHDADIVDGEWREFVIFGTDENPEVDMFLPNTKAILEQQLPGAVAMAKIGAGEIIFSALAPGAHLVPHCASSNIRLTCHLGLMCPPGARIRVGDTWGTWQEGKCMFFDDSFEHEVIHEGKAMRIVLLIRFWHPDLAEQQWIPTLERVMKFSEELKRRRVTPPMTAGVKTLVAEPMQKHLHDHGLGFIVLGANRYSYQHR